jgi:hypothetical protein
MKRAAMDHPKLLDLCERLGAIPLYQGVGILETVWHFTARFAPAGDVGRFSDAALVRFVQWPHESHQLISALVESGWIDRDETHRLLVHDWSEHCDEAVHMSLARAGKFFASGIAPRISRLPKEERERAATLLERTTSARQAHGKRIKAHGKRTASARHAVAPPEPRQSPAIPEPEDISGADPVLSLASPKEPTPISGKRAKRVPDEFDLTPPRLDFATAHGLTVKEAEMQFDKMCDTEFLRAHTDWDGVWRNWVRTHVERHPIQLQRR